MFVFLDFKTLFVFLLNLSFDCCRDARKTEDKTFVAAPFQPVEPGTEWERWISCCSLFVVNLFLADSQKM